MSASIRSLVWFVACFVEVELRYRCHATMSGGKAREGAQYIRVRYIRCERAVMAPPARPTKEFGRELILSQNPDLNNSNSSADRRSHNLSHLILKWIAVEVE